MEEIQEMVITSLNYINNDLVIPVNENILVIDNSCYQTIVDINAFLTEYFAGIQLNVGGALNSMESTKLELFYGAYTLITLPNNVKVISKLTKHSWIMSQYK